jgi:HD-GYP domain-containing protein (c-di-GMP phosphodiesterase class II)
LTARILQVTDVYDALTTDRPYRDSLTQEQALEIMREEVRRGWWELIRKVPMKFAKRAGSETHVHAGQLL